MKNASSDTFSRTFVCFVDLPHSLQCQEILREDGVFQIGERFVGVLSCGTLKGRKSAPESLLPLAFQSDFIAIYIFIHMYVSYLFFKPLLSHC